MKPRIEIAKLNPKVIPSLQGLGALALRAVAGNYRPGMYQRAAVATG